MKTKPVNASRFNRDLKLSECEKRANKTVKDIITDEGKNRHYAKVVEEIEKQYCEDSMIRKFLGLTFIEVAELFERNELNGIDEALKKNKDKYIAEKGEDFYEEYEKKFKEIARNFRFHYIGRRGRKKKGEPKQPQVKDGKRRGRKPKN